MFLTIELKECIIYRVLARKKQVIGFEFVCQATCSCINDHMIDRASNIAPLVIYVNVNVI